MAKAGEAGSADAWAASSDGVGSAISAWATAVAAVQAGAAQVACTAREEARPNC